MKDEIVLNRLLDERYPLSLLHEYTGVSLAALAALRSEALHLVKKVGEARAQAQASAANRQRETDLDC